MEIVELDAGSGVTVFSTMRGNVSGDGVGNLYSEFNVCHYTGDSVEHIALCRSELAKYIGASVEKLVIPRQTHSVNVAIIGDEIPNLEGVDALVTRRDDVVLMVNTADCLPIVFNDSQSGVIGIAHGGWRGLYNGIIEVTIEAMIGLGSEPRDMRVAIGPCICGECYEVDEEFARRFAERMGDCVKVSSAWEKPHVDLRVAAVGELERCGVGRNQVSVAEECSRCDERFFSARRMGVQSGRIATVVKKVGV